MSVQTAYSKDPAIAIEGQLADKDAAGKLILSKINAEATAEVAFGLAVKRGSGDQDALLPAANSDAVLGIVMHSNAFGKPDELGDTGLKPGVVMDVVRRGRMYIACEDGCSPGDRLYVRAVATGSERLGAMRASADSTDTIDATGQGMWVTTAAAGGLAILEFDFLNDAV